jgi:hypothetical protein
MLAGKADTAAMLRLIQARAPPTPTAEHGAARGRGARQFLVSARVQLLGRAAERQAGQQSLACTGPRAG